MNGNVWICGRDGSMAYERPLSSEMPARIPLGADSRLSYRTRLMFVKQTDIALEIVCGSATAILTPSGDEVRDRRDIILTVTTTPGVELAQQWKDMYQVQAYVRRRVYDYEPEELKPEG